MDVIVVSWGKYLKCLTEAIENSIEEYKDQPYVPFKFQEDLEEGWEIIF